jgi:hypothetical protein
MGFRGQKDLSRIDSTNIAEVPEDHPDLPALEEEIAAVEACISSYRQLSASERL